MKKEEKKDENANEIDENVEEYNDDDDDDISDLEDDADCFGEPTRGPNAQVNNEHTFFDVACFLNENWIFYLLLLFKY